MSESGVNFDVVSFDVVNYDVETQVVRSDMRSYYALMPNIADDVLNLYEYRLYGHYLRVCGEQNRPCVEKTVTTAARCDMSAGKVSEARRLLAERGFIALHEVKQGNLTRVFVTLLDIWPKNIAQYSDVQRSPGERQRSYGERQCSPGERYLQEFQRSPGERPKNKPPIKNKPVGKKEPPPKGSKGGLAGEEEGLAGGAALGEEGLAGGDWPAVRLDLIPLAKAMLEECGLVSEIAQVFAETRDFETLREYVMAWRGDPDAGVGALKYRIEFNWRHSPLMEGDYTDAFYLRYRTPEEVARDKLRVVVQEDSSGFLLGAVALSSSPETPGLASATPVTPAVESEHAKLWASVLEEMRAWMATANFRRVFADTAPVTLSGDELIVAAPAAMLDILRNRYGRKILQAVYGVAGRPLLVAFVAQETVQP